MSELKRVMEILFKTELSSQKIELALIDDAEKMFRVRAAEAKDFLDIVGKVSNQIAASLRLI